MNLKKIEKYIEYFITKVKVSYKEKKFISNNYRIKYMLEKNDSDILVIVFSGFTRIGIKARYNYNRTLKKLKVNKLFILDDFGYDERGAYYLGHNSDYKIQKAVSNLIAEIQSKLAINKSIYVGSSKGGYAAIYFGVKDNEAIIISGAPQYRLGNYLSLNEYMINNTLKYIVGDDVTEEKHETLNNILKNRLSDSKHKNNKIYLHYSKEDHTYTSHIQYLIDDLKLNGYNYTEDIGNYKNHMDVSLYYPSFLVGTISKYI